MITCPYCNKEMEPDKYRTQSSRDSLFCNNHFNVEVKCVYNNIILSHIWLYYQDYYILISLNKSIIIYKKYSIEEIKLVFDPSLIPENLPQKLKTYLMFS